MITHQLMWHQVNVYKIDDLQAHRVCMFKTITVTKSKHWMPFDLIPARNKKMPDRYSCPAQIYGLYNEITSINSAAT